MYLNFLKTSIRNLMKNRLHSLILIAGLTLGMTACMLLLQYVSFELSFDQFHAKKNRIYRVVNERFQQGASVQKGAITYPTIGPTMAREFPEVINYTRLAYSPDLLITIDNQIEEIEPGLWADEHFFELFDFQLLAREDIELLDAANEVVLTKSLADRYFPAYRGDYESMIGKDLRVDTYDHPFRVVGICADAPVNSHLDFDLLLSYASTIRYWGEGADNSWTWSDFYHYIELKPEADPVALEAKFADFSERHFEGSTVSGSEEVFSLQPLSDIHLQSSELEYEIGKTTSGRAVWILLAIAFSILVIAWINYVNLSSARAIERAREVGIRKVIGATRGQLIRQFLTEALLLNMLSLFLAFGLVVMATPYITSLTGIDERALSFLADNQLNGYLFLALAGLIVLGVFASGLYPAFLLAAPHVASVLKGKFAKDETGALLRKGLVVFQFSLSIGLLAASVLIHKQLRYMMQEDLGITTEQVIRLNPPELTRWDSTFIPRMNTLKTELRKLPGVVQATTSSRVPGEAMGRFFNMRRSNSSGDGPTYTTNYIQVDQDFAETYELPVIAGRFFRRGDHHEDIDRLDKIVVNATLVRMLGYSNEEAALNERLNLYDKDWQIVGVIADFHQQSLHQPIEPLVLFPMYGTLHQLSVRLQSDRFDQTLAQIKDRYEAVFPGNAFEFEFLDARIEALYRSDLLFSNALRAFMLLTILIACLGLFGLASYTIFLRTKEVGIRRVLGASTGGIVALLSKDFLLLVLVALVIAIPLTYYGIQQWLENYAYRIDIPWWIFPAAGGAALVVAFLTVGVQAMRVALANPVRALRSE